MIFNYLKPQSTLSMRNKAYPQWIWPSFGFILLIVFNFLRSWATLSVPGLHMEDALLFGYYYGHERPLKSIFSSHTGQPYLTSVVDFFAWSVAFLDVRIQPVAYLWIGNICAAITATLIFFTGFIRSKALLLMGPLILGLTGLNHIYYHITLIYVMYTGVLALIILLFFPPPRSAIGYFLQAFFFAVLPWCGPYSVLFLPVATLYIFFFHDKVKVQVILLGCCSTLIYLLTVSGSTIRLSHFTQPWVIKRYFQVLLEKVVFLQLFDYVPLYAGLIVLAIILLLFYFFRHQAFFIKASVVLFAAITISLSLFFLSIKFPLYLYTSDCHRVVSVFFWIVFLLFTSDKLITAAGNQYRVVVLSIFLVLFSGIVLRDNLKYPKRGWVEPVPDVYEFTKAVSFVESLQLKEKKQQVCLTVANHPYPLLAARVYVGYHGADRRELQLDDLNQDFPYSQYICPVEE